MSFILVVIINTKNQSVDFARSQFFINKFDKPVNFLWFRSADTKTTNRQKAIQILLSKRKRNMCGKPRRNSVGKFKSDLRARFDDGFSTVLEAM